MFPALTTTHTAEKVSQSEAEKVNRFLCDFFAGTQHTHELSVTSMQLKEVDEIEFPVRSLPLPDGRNET